MRTSSNRQHRIIFPSHIVEVRVPYSSKIKEADSSPRDRPQVTSSRDAAEIFRLKWRKNRIQYVEDFKVILMNRAAQVLGVHHVPQGGISGCVVDPKVVFADG